jgi:hypothetical protein
MRLERVPVLGSTLPIIPAVVEVILVSGGVLSYTLIVIDFVAMFPLLSTALHVTSVSPKEKIEFEIGLQLAFRVPSTPSVALILYVTIRP